MLSGPAGLQTQPRSCPPHTRPCALSPGTAPSWAGAHSPAPLPDYTPYPEASSRPLEFAVGAPYGPPRGCRSAFLLHSPRTEALVTTVMVAEGTWT